MQCTTCTTLPVGSVCYLKSYPGNCRGNYPSVGWLLLYLATLVIEEVGVHGSISATENLIASGKRLEEA